jgi:hypothetical protein
MLLALLLALPGVSGAAPGDATAPAEPRMPDDRPYTGDPGPEPPPAPARPREDDARPDPRAARPAPARPEPARPGPAPATNVTPPRPDLVYPRGPNLLTVGVGFSVGLSPDTPGGARVHLGWSYRLTRYLWLDLIGDLGLGAACQATGRDSQNRQVGYECGGFRGIGIGLLAGVQWKFLSLRRWKVPVVPFARAAVGPTFLISDGPNDGAGLTFRLGGGARYYFKPWLSVGGELAATLGPTWRSDLPLGFHGALDLVASMELLF